jgi:putative acetyltransferase
VQRGLEALKQRGAAGVALIGNPDIYGRFGLESDGLLTGRGLESRLVLRVISSGPVPQGELRFVAAFEDA